MRLAPLVFLAACLACSPSRIEPLDPSPRLSVHPARLRLSLVIDGEPVTVDLTRKTELLAPGFEVRLFDGVAERALPASAVAADCLYDGDVRGGSATSWAALSTCDGVRGVVVLDGAAWSLEPGPTPDAVVLSRVGQAVSGVTVPVTRLPLEPGLSRAALVPPTKYVELATWVDTTFFTANMANTQQRVVELVNVADSAYRRGALSPAPAIALRSVVIFTTTMPFTWTTSGGEADMTSLLTNFTTWVNGSTSAPRGDVRSLVTALDFSGSAIGFAGVGTACGTNNTTITQHTFNNTTYHGLTLAHEIGHSLGMQHDTGPCNPSAFVMAAVGCSNCGTFPTTFSSCSQASYSQWLATSQLASCLDDIPSQFVAPRCGDGIVQAGERCDCGDTDCSTNDPCCNGATCQLVAGATCATLDGCCDSCRPATTARSCRPGNGGCDLGATCNTVSSYCPPNRFVTAGTACNDGNSPTGGACYRGQCVSHLDQCQDVVAQGFPISGVTTCSNQASFNLGNFCNVLYCGTNNNQTACTSFNPGGSPVRVRDGVRCASGSQCVSQMCVASTTIDPTRTFSFLAGPWGFCCGGVATRTVVCVDNEGRLEPDSACAGPKPATAQSCSPSACNGYTWQVGSFGTCSAVCQGTQTRTVTCVEVGTGATVADSLCALNGPKPVTSQACGGPCFSWVTGAFGVCSVACGGGTQSRTVSCLDVRTSAVVSDGLCSDAGPRPSTSQTCNTQACPTYGWQTSAFGMCSATCGGGTQTRTVTCVEQGTGTVVADTLCASAGPRPSTSQTCNTQACPTYSWQTSAFGTCSTTCGGGTQTRTVTCVEQGTSTVVADTLCASAGPRPATSQTCNTQPCVWQASAFSACSLMCGGGMQTRTVTCVDSGSGMEVSETLCASSGPRPASSQTCNTQACATYAWQTGTFSACSATCGGGTQTRPVTCIEQGSGTVVADTLCASAGPRPASSQTCNTQACATYAWQPGTFSACSATCGGGTQTRPVTCIEQGSGTVVADTLCASVGPRPELSQACNTDPCASWLTGAYGECSASCGTGTRTRTVTCVAAGSSTAVPEAQCTGPRPQETTTCEGPCIDAGAAGGGTAGGETGGSGGGAPSNGLGCSAASGLGPLLAAVWLVRRRRSRRTA